MEVYPGIHQFRIPMPNNPLGFVNAYLIRSDGECLLVDTGWDAPEALDALDEQLRELHLGFRDLDRILITHIHPDHFGMAGKIQAMSGARLILHKLEKVFIETRYANVDNLLDEMAEFLRMHGAPPEEVTKLQRSSLDLLALVSPARVDSTVTGGERIDVGPFHFDVVWTPGHSAGHICLYEPEQKILLSGDHILPSISPNVSLHPQYTGNPLADYLDSLTLIEELQTELVLPGHRNVFKDAAARARELRQHHADRMEAIRGIVRERPLTAYETAARMSWAGGRMKWEEMALFSRRIALTEALAHLDLMRAEGSVSKTFRDGLVYFRGTKDDRRLTTDD